MNMKNKHTRFLSGLAVTVAALTGNSLAETEPLNIGGIIFPHLHANVAVGDASEAPESLTSGGHDPSSSFTVQGIEAGLSLQLHEQINGFATWNFGYGAEDEWEDEFEEGFLKLKDLPGGFEFRGGRMLTRLGLRNDQHLHAWETIDQHLVNGRFLGDDGLLQDGGDITWRPPTPNPTALTISYGEAPQHGHGDEEEEDPAEEIGFSDTFLSANLKIRTNRDDFNQFTASASLAQGENEFTNDTTLFGLGGNYTWRENGLEAGGRQFSWTTEIFLRDAEGGIGHGHEEDEEEHHDEEEEEHHDEDEEDEDHDEEENELIPDTDEIGFYTSAVYRFAPQWDLGLRFDHVEGIDALGIPQRTRLSPHLTHYLGKEKNMHVRLQYNYEDRENDDTAHAAWLQFAFNFGSSEVR